MDYFDGSYQLKAKDFFFKILSGSAQGILIGVLPSAVLKYLLKLFITPGVVNWASDLNAILVLFQTFIPVLIGVCIALQFKMKPLDVGTLGIAVAAASGSIKWGTAPAGFMNPITHVKSATAAPIYVASGAGDVINAMIVAAIGALAIWLIAKYLGGFGSVAIILTPIVVGGGVGLIGKEIAPYVGSVTTWIGQMVETFTRLQPVPMAMLIAMTFAIIIITPVSTVGIALAISLAGVGSAAAGVGVIATTVILLINSIKVNKKGTSIAIFLGAMKGMMPSVFAKPVTMISFLITAAISGIPVALMNVQGTPTSAGFGWIGLVTPIQAVAKDAADAQWINNYVNPLVSIIVFFVVPIVAGFIVDYVLTKIVKLYKPMDFQQEI
ncbi:PTS transporter subunit IIC [Weissella kandleri]|uniref:PTS transporter subunit IIC n=1 Tax=Weissella kandleri TaxID=1616 RepID=UPI00387E3C2D